MCTIPRLLRRVLPACLTLGFLLAQLFALAGQQATAVATVTGGYVTAITVTSGGSGYSVPPVVQIAGGGGFGATGTALVSGDAVSFVVVTSPGTGYTNAPLVTIAPPAGPPSLALELVPKLTVTGTPGTLAEIQWSSGVDASANWQSWTNVPVGPFGAILVDLAPGSATRFYRAVTASIPAVPSGFVWIPPGTFQMGSPTTEVSRLGYEDLHTVTLTHGFWICDHVVTQGEYFQVMGDKLSTPYVTNLPVVTISRDNAQAYVAQLTFSESQSGHLANGYAYRLPTEAEWEYAARAGTQTRFYWFDDPQFVQASNYCWYSQNSGGMTHPVRTKIPNAFGLYDMAGNVFQWCSDWYANYDLSISVDPTGPQIATPYGVARGGSFNSPASQCRCAARIPVTYGAGNGESGIRVVLSEIRH